MPYSNLPDHAFWKLCRADPAFRQSDLYAPKVLLEPGMRVATAGSCFAQNIGRYIRASTLHLVDMEPAPTTMPVDVATRYGYGLFSARYGNVYTTRQLRQLLEDAETAHVRDCAVWTDGDRIFDGLRPNTEPDGYGCVEELAAHRRDHLHRVRALFDETDVFVFTLGLTEAWADRDSGTIFPTAPGVVAGRFNPTRHRFVNLGMADTLEDLDAAIRLMRRYCPGLKILLTVSPVPLTATASGVHILRATTYSKAVLRAVVEEVAAGDPDIDYFPSYEIITGAPFRSAFYAENLRSVTQEGVSSVMSVFFSAHPALGHAPEPALPQVGVAEPAEGTDETVCEEALLEAFARS